MSGQSKFSTESPLLEKNIKLIKTTTE